MAVPGFQSMTLPILRGLADGGVATLGQIRGDVSKHLKLSESDLAEMLPSGKQTVRANRVAWACVYLAKAELLRRPKRGSYQVTDRGIKTLKDPPARIDITYLERFPEFLKFRPATKGKKAKKKDVPVDPDVPPLEQLERAHEQLQSALADEVLEQVMACSPQFFESLVVELLVEMGYGGSIRDAGVALGKSGDEGIDGIIKEDRLGLDVIYVQAKRWSGTVGRPEIQKFVGALHGKHARKGVFLTTGAFSKGAREYAQSIDSSVVLVDGELLGTLMIEHGLGVSSYESYAVKRLDSDYFAED